MQLQKIRMTLTGGLKGKTIVLHRRKFVGGVFEATVTLGDVSGLKKYYTTCYQVKFENLTGVTLPPELQKTEAEVKEDPKYHYEAEAQAEAQEEADADAARKDNKAIRVDDSAVMSEQEVEDKEDDVVTPNNRQQAIIAAVNKTEKEKWIEQDTNPHPKVADVASIMDDPTVTKEEIVEVIETWLS